MEGVKKYGYFILRLFGFFFSFIHPLNTDLPSSYYVSDPGMKKNTQGPCDGDNDFTLHKGLYQCFQIFCRGIAAAPNLYQVMVSENPIFYVPTEFSA